MMSSASVVVRGSYSNTPTDITVERTSSRNFTSECFSTAISTSDSPNIAGQPSDVIVGGGASPPSSPSRSTHYWLKQRSLPERKNNE